MKKLYKKIKDLEKSILEKRVELAQIDTLPYYNEIGNESERERDRAEVMNELKDLYSTLGATLDSMKIEINLKKNDMSTAERKLSLVKNIA